ncbi:MAG TPA: LysR family transcriptional regulator [Burkholderiales bacterium]|nr:LysR family transcriptional regulator [Burkholderiales bacterium]
MSTKRVIDLRQLDYYVRVAELGSFTKAAGALSVAQSALSRQVSLLERQFGTRLLHRTGRGVLVTEEGQRALHAMKSLLAEAEHLAADLKASRGELSGTVNLGVLAGLSPALLTPLLYRVHDRFPGVRMSVREGLTHHVEEWLADGTVELGIIYHSRAMQRATDQPLLRTELHLMGAPGDRLTRRKSVRLAELAHLPMLLPAVPNRHRTLLEKIFEEHQVALDVVIELDSIITMKDLAASGRGHTILPLHAAYREIAAGHLQAARIMGPSISRTVLLTSTTQRPMSRACREVERLILEVVAGLVASGQLPARR